MDRGAAAARRAPLGRGVIPWAAASSPRKRGSRLEPYVWLPAFAGMTEGVRRRSSHFAAGPTVKVSLGESTALMAGAVFDVSSAAGTPVFTFQLTRSL